MMFSKKTPAILATFFIGFALSGSALACSLDGWDDAVNVVVGQPFDATPPDLDGVARFEEFCAMVAAGTGYVETNSPEHGEVTNRFYVWPDVDAGTGNADILIGYSENAGGGSELFSIAFDGTDFVFTTSAEDDSAAAADGWNLIEYHWNGDTFEYWVNADATTEDPTGEIGGGGAATLESVHLGLPNGLGDFTGMFNFDSFEMHNTTPIGPLLNCDAEPSGDINISDVVAVIDDFTEAALSNGTPNCDPLVADINISDVVETINVFTAN